MRVPTISIALLLLVLLVEVESSGGGYSDDPIDDVRKYTTEFSAVFQSSGDLLVQLGFVSANMGGLLKLGGPVASLAAAFLESLLSPGSPEILAIRQLHTTMTTIHEDLARRIQHESNDDRLFLTLQLYGIRVDDSLNALNRIAEDAFDPNIGGGAYLLQFKDRCLGSQSPIDTLEYIWRNVKVQCKEPTAEYMQVHMAALQLFADLEHSMAEFTPRSSLYSAYQRDKANVFSRLPNLSYEEGTKLIQRLRAELLGTSGDTSYPGPWMVVDIIERIMDKVKVESDQCLLNIVMNAHLEKRKPLIDFGKLLVHDMGRLVMMGLLCSNVSHGGDPEKFHRDIQRMETYVRETAYSMKEWIRLRLELIWPLGMEVYVKEAIDEKRTPDPYSYNFTAEHIRAALNARGPPRFYHTVIVHTLPDTFHYSFSYATSNSHKMVGVKGLSVVFSRFVEDDPARSARAFDWYQRSNTTILETIATNWKTDDLAWLLQEINRKVGGGVADPNRYANALALRQTSWWAADCVINFGIAASPGPSMTQAWQVAPFFDSGHILPPQDAESFLIFFTL